MDTKPAHLGYTAALAHESETEAVLLWSVTDKVTYIDWDLINSIACWFDAPVTNGNMIIGKVFSQFNLLVFIMAKELVLAQKAHQLLQNQSQKNTPDLDDVRQKDLIQVALAQVVQTPYLSSKDRQCAQELRSNVLKFIQQ